MNLNLIEKIGDGAFGDVWRGNDQLDRDVAVKIIRPAGLGVADALAHAKALARATHPNVVSVYTIEKVIDPDSEVEVDCVVMELIKGITLTKRLGGNKLTFDEAKNIGLGIIDGLSHIHNQNMAHGDLHSENVMVVDNFVKVIDILYLNSLATLSSEMKGSRLRRYLVSLRLMLQQVIVHSEFDPAEATEFNNLLDVDATCDEMRSAFLQIVSPENATSESRGIEHSFGRLTEVGFVEGESYAAALDEETLSSIILPLLKKIVDEKIYDPKHSHYINAIWARLPLSQRTEFLKYLSSILDKDVPKGTWAPTLRLLTILGSDGWQTLSNLVKIKLEGLIIKDTLAGKYDIHSAKPLSGGALGTYATLFWPHFQHQSILADNLISLLRQDWYTQNYVASFFMRIIPTLAQKTNKKAEFVEAFKIAMRNDARLVKSKLENLPKDWISEIKGMGVD